jgi:hypothetical protein
MRGAETRSIEGVINKREKPVEIYVERNLTCCHVFDHKGANSDPRNRKRATDHLKCGMIFT